MKPGSEFGRRRKTRITLQAGMATATGQRMAHVRRFLFWLVVMGTATSVEASRHKALDPATELAKYIARVKVDAPAASYGPGSTWMDTGRMASLATDYKAALVGDVITIAVAHSLTSSNGADVSTARTYSASSGVTALPGGISVSKLANLLGLQSAETLAGTGKADTTSSLTTTLSGRVVAVLGSGNLVIEAERVIDMNNEKQTMLLRGLVRRGDIGPNNTVADTSIGDLELSVKGKGVISNGVRPPHPILRAIIRILNF
jgi:flagellar L-ring protein precursor FlgH